MAREIHSSVNARVSFRRIQRMLHRGCAALALTAAVSAASAGSSSGPDLIVGDMNSITRWGTIDGITAYSPNLTVCNIGDQPAASVQSTNQHPIYSYNLYRHFQGRFEQIGQAWIRHEFCTLAQPTCGTCTPATPCSQLGVGCASPSSASAMGSQPVMGPRGDINPATGGFNMPFTSSGVSGDALFKRLQVRNDDLNPALHPGAAYVLEGIAHSPDDAVTGNNLNNSSWRPITVGGLVSGGYALSVAGATVREATPLDAWQALDATVQLSTVDVPGDGRIVLGSRVTSLGGGQWLYQYALYNQTSHRAGRQLLIPRNGAAVSAQAFRDVGYHSGDPYDGTDWTGTVGPTQISWSTTDFSSNPNANALRWGTLYNFEFVADRPATAGSADVSLFRPGAPESVAIATSVPTPIYALGDMNCDLAVNFDDINGFVLAIVSEAAYAAEYPECSRALADVSGDGQVNFDDIEAFVVVLVGG